MMKPVSISDKDFVEGLGSGQKLSGGLDIYKNFTPNYVGAFSYKTDFAETEVDERRINLTRFPLCFPEKRTFFLEGSEIYNFGLGNGESFIPFFSRQIGLYKGQQIPLIFSTKIFGKLGNTNLAILGVKTNSSEGLLTGNFVAARAYQNILDQSKVGMIFTSGSPSGEKNSLFGLDLVYSTSQFRGDKSLSVGGWWVHNWNESNRGHHQAFGCMVDYPNELWDCRLIYGYFGDSLNPGLGFLPRNNVQNLSWRGSFQPRPQQGLFAGPIRQFFLKLKAVTSGTWPANWKRGTSGSFRSTSRRKAASTSSLDSAPSAIFFPTTLRSRKAYSSPPVLTIIRTIRSRPISLCRQISA